MTATIFGASDRAYALIPVTTQTGTYTAGTNALIPCDTTSGAFTVTLPAAPPDLTAVAVKLLAGTNTLTIATGAGDAYDTGGTSQTLTIPGQGMVAQYDATAALWHVSSDELPLADLDARYVGATAGATIWFNVKAAAYGAKGDGTTNDRAAINAALAAANAAGGGIVYFPAGTYLVTPTGASPVGLTLMGTSQGYQNVHLVGDGQGATVIQQSSGVNGVLLQASGPSSSAGTGTTHCRGCSLHGITFNGNSTTGALLQCYYTDQIVVRDCYFENNNDTAIDTAELWEFRFEDLTFIQCTGTSGSSTQPNINLRNSAASSGFGYSTDSTNNGYLRAIRGESFGTGVISVGAGVNNTNGAYMICATDVKCESYYLQGPYIINVDNSCAEIFLRNVYVFAGGFQSPYSTAVNAIQWGAARSSLSDVTIANSTTATISSGVDLTSQSGSIAVLRNVIGNYTTAPTGSHIYTYTSTGGTYDFTDCYTNAGTLYGGVVASGAASHVVTSSSASGTWGVSNGTAVTGNANADLSLTEASATSKTFGSKVSGDTFNRFETYPDGTLRWGPGNAAIDATLSRTGVGALFFGANVTVNGTAGFNNNIGVTGIAAHNGGTQTSGSAPVVTPALANGTAAQLSDITRDYMVYFTVGTAGSAFSVAIGPTSAAADTIVSSNTPNAGESIGFRLPAGWFVKWAGTSTTLANQKAIGC